MDASAEKSVSNGRDMLIEISAEQLEIGMYVHSLDLAWYDHPFWSRRFLIRDQSDLDALLKAGTKQIVIDLEKGNSPTIVAPNVGYAGNGISQQRPSGSSSSTISDRPKTRAVFSEETDKRPIPLIGRERTAEMRRASKMLHRSKAEVMNLFGDARMGKAISTRKISNLVTQISDSVNKDPSIILNVARLKSKDEYTFLHSVSVCALMINLGRKIGLDEDTVQDLGMAGMLHDLGKMTIPDPILNKAGKLDDEEWRIVRNHPEKGHAILAQAKCGTETALDVCLHHHEKMDGTGYPHRITGDNISLAARMAAICDVYDAITSKRSYNEPLSGAVALSKMLSWKGHFDQLLLRSFVESLGIVPIGSVVHLTNETLAVVIGEDPEDFSLPIVRTFYDLREEAPCESIDIGISRIPGSVQVRATIYDPDPALDAMAQIAMDRQNFAAEKVARRIAG